MLLKSNLKSLPIGSMHPLTNLPEDIYKVLEGRSVFDSSIVDQFGESIKEVLLKRLSKEEREPSLRMSNIGRPLRQLYYEMNKYPSELLEGKTLLKFLYGDLIEATVIALAQVAGYQLSDLQEHIEVDGIPGHIDVKINNILTDVKSASPFGFEKFRSGSILDKDADPFGYVGQLSGYAHALNLPAAWVCINKVSGEICILSLPQEKIDAYDVKNRIATVRAAVASKEVPGRCYQDKSDGKSGNRILDTGCSYCGFKQECWKDSNDGKGLRGFAYSTGIKYLTTVTLEPRVFEIKGN